MRRLLMFAVAAGLSSGASAMPVSTFLVKATALQKKGPLALLSGDLKLLMNQIKTDGTQLSAENKALAAAGKTKAYCVPPGGVNITNRIVLQAMNEVPVAQRSTTSTKQAMRAYFARRYPCRG